MQKVSVVAHENLIIRTIGIVLLLEYMDISVLCYRKVKMSALR